MAGPPRLGAGTPLLIALLLVLSGGWLATSTGSPAPAPGRAEPKLITYHGPEARATMPLRADRLPGVPSDFRRFVKQQLHALWDDLGHTPGCKSSPLITVHAVRTDGFGLGDVN